MLGTGCEEGTEGGLVTGAMVGKSRIVGERW